MITITANLSDVLTVKRGNQTKGGSDHFETGVSTIARTPQYLPSGPPFSPLTASYFFFWSTFDAAIGIRKETLGTRVIALMKQLENNPDFMRLVEIMRHSRMGLYEHQGVENECVWLRELVTGVDARCLVPAGRLGKAGEVWLARRGYRRHRRNFVTASRSRHPRRVS
jgi:hypothetical protein